MKTSFESKYLSDADGGEEPRRETDYKALAAGLGWFSIGLGASQILMPDRVSRLAGLENHRSLMRFLGAREIAAGIGILTRRHSGPWLWARVAGDAMDLALLGAAFASDQSDRGKTIAAAATVIGVTALDSIAAVNQTKHTRSWRSRRAITVRTSPEGVYRFWRDFNNMPRFMKYVESVEDADSGRRFVWRAAGPFGRTFEWETEITADAPNEFIEWRSDGPVPNSGRVEFRRALNDRGTEVRLEVEGPIPPVLLEEDLRRMKRLVETGEIPTTAGQPRGPSRTAVFSRLVHAIEDKGGVL